MLQLNQVSLRRGDRLLFANATLQAHAGQRLGLTGANGSGKSSLFAAILGELEPDEGSITLDRDAASPTLRRKVLHRARRHWTMSWTATPNCAPSRPA
jgi:ATPase subunit of ABC transporter with duplicated ATPase domains